MRCYIEFYTIPYTEEPDLPPPGAVLAACAPLNSKWRKMVRIAHRKPIDVPLESL